MILQRLFALSTLVIGVCHAATQASLEGLVAVHSWQLDQVHLRPNADLAGYRKVLIDPAQVSLRKDRQHAYNRIPTPAVPAQEAQRIAGASASSLQAAVAEAFKARGYEIVAAPGPGVLRLTPSAAELFINAPDDLSAGTWSFTREAGQATLALEARDALSGTLLGRVVHQATARQMGRLNLADEVTNQFWFEALFRRWAASCAEALGQ
jgi:hypothetical protein